MNQDLQTTLARPVEWQGKGLHTGIPASLRLVPAPAGNGVVFVRTDLPGRPRVKASVAHVTTTERGTRLRDGAASADTVEHLLAALFGLGLDNVTAELSGPEVPILDGSAREYSRAIALAGLVSLESPRDWFKPSSPLVMEEGGKRIAYEPADGLTVSFEVDYGHPYLGRQHATVAVNPANFLTALSPARTFCFEHEIDAMRKAGLARGGDLTCALVIGDKGLLNPPLRFPDEYVRHKILDFLGDLSLLGRPVTGHFRVEKSGHTFNVKMVKELLKQAGPVAADPAPKKEKPVSTAPKALLEAKDIEALLPHRYPMLLVDRIIELEPGKRIVGIKSVSMNEWFFPGHFPGFPVMPGVLIVEAMAQCGGVLIMKSGEENRGKIFYFMAIDACRFRKPVLPGDTLRFVLVVEKFKSGRICKMKGEAFVGEDLVCEADLMSMMLDKT